VATLYRYGKMGDSKVKMAIVSMLALALVTALGSYYENAVVPYVVIGMVCAVAVLIALDKIKPREYPVYIYGLSLALLWQTTMFGSYIVGADIHGELFVANRAIAQGWDWSYVNVNNTSLVLGGLTPLLAKIGFAPVWQFKALYPALFAGVPLILWFAYSKMMGEKRAFWAVLFFMFMPVFFVEIVGIVKSMVAEVFLALMVLFMVVDLKAWQKGVGIGMSAVIAMLCHYTVGILAVLFLAGGLVVSLAGRVAKLSWFKRMRVPVAHYALIITIASASLFGWFGIMGNGFMLKSFGDVGESVAIYAGLAGHGEDVNSQIPQGNPANNPSYLYSQEPLVQTAIGLDFADASVGGKVFRVLQYITQLLLILGLVYLLFRHKKYGFTAEFMACVVVGFGLLGMCLFLPSFSTIINASRFYQISLFFLAPMLVVGVEELGNDISRGVGWLKRYQ